MGDDGKHFQCFPSSPTKTSEKRFFLTFFDTNEKNRRFFSLVSKNVKGDFSRLQKDDAHSSARKYLHYCMLHVYDMNSIVSIDL